MQFCSYSWQPMQSEEHSFFVLIISIVKYLRGGFTCANFVVFNVVI